MAIPILTTVDPGNGANTCNVTFYVSTATQSRPAQQVTIAQYPTSNPAFARAVQVSDEFLFVKRGTGVVAFPISDLCGIGVSQVPAVSYSPLITLQPVSQSVTANNAAFKSFNVAANSETTLTYAWAANNGTGWVTSISNTSNNAGGVYSLISATSLKVKPVTNSPNSVSIVCTVYNSTGNTNTSQVTLTVL
jgi:hypothetical protein